LLVNGAGGGSLGSLVVDGLELVAGTLLDDAVEAVVFCGLVVASAVPGTTLVRGADPPGLICVGTDDGEVLVVVAVVVGLIDNGPVEDVTVPDSATWATVASIEEPSPESSLENVGTRLEPTVVEERSGRSAGASVSPLSRGSRMKPPTIITAIADPPATAARRRRT
jgi:hypothetical protein